MADSPLVSIIMNCLNCEKYLREAIASIYSQTYPNWEIIFWDNNSTDKSAEIAQNFDQRLRYFKGDDTVPLGEARNHAIEKAKGEFIAFLDCDDIWLPEKLVKQIPLFDDHEVGIVFCDVIFFNELGMEKRLYDKEKYSTGRCFRALLGGYFLSMPALVIRRSALAAMDKWFNPRFNFIEEADLMRRLSYSWKLAMVNEPLAKWRVHGNSLTYSNNFLFSQESFEMLEDYSRNYPDFQADYAREILALKRQIHLCEAAQHFRTGDKIKAREWLLPYKTSSIKLFLLFLLSFLPVSIIHQLFKMSGSLSPLSSSDNS